MALEQHELEHLFRVVNYLYRDEEKDCESYPEGDRDGHILNSVLVLEKILEHHPEQYKALVKPRNAEIEAEFAGLSLQ